MLSSSPANPNRSDDTHDLHVDGIGSSNSNSVKGKLNHSNSAKIEDNYQKGNSIDSSEFDVSDSSGSSSDSSDLEESVSLRSVLKASRPSSSTNRPKEPGELSPIRSFRPISFQDNNFYQAQFRRPNGRTLEEIQQKRKRNSQNERKTKRRRKTKRKKTNSNSTRRASKKSNLFKGM